MRLLRIAVLTPLRRSFDYLAPNHWDYESLAPGIRIKVPFAKRELIGVLLEKPKSTHLESKQLKEAIEIIDNKPLINSAIMQLTKWASEYYHHAIGEVIVGTLPKLLREPKRIKKINLSPLVTHKNKPSPILTLNLQQQAAVDAVLATDKFATFLLDGVTGSGKTEVYLRIIEQVLKQGKQSLVLVPEIGLTPQTVNRFQNRFAEPIAISHSQLTDKERLNAWMATASGEARILIGTRSAIFTPIPNLGIIIVDEEHDLSFKQQAGFRYSARDLAIVRAKIENIPIILGSATPSLESYYNVEQKKYTHLHLPKRAGNATQPTFHLIDLRQQKLKSGLAKKMQQEMQTHIEKNNQILVFLNRRGYAPALLCPSCGWTATCNRCDAKMTLHKKPKFLYCHHCGATKPINKECPQCRSTKLAPVGVGTERLEETIKELFAEQSILRIDRDTTRKKGAMKQMLNEINNNNYQILIGTQMLAKGHHFPNVTMSAIIDIDSGFLSSDFRATEYCGQLITQVAGRSGREEKKGEVFIQTYNPEHPLLLKLITEGYRNFTVELLRQRRIAKLPPYSYLALLRTEAKSQQIAVEFLEKIKDHALKNQTDAVKILGPIPAPLERKKNRYHAQLLINSKQRKTLHQLLDEITNFIEQQKVDYTLRWSLDIDPVDML